MIRSRFFSLLGCAVALGAEFSAAQEEKPEEPPPVRALLVTGGCCHDYETQKAILTAGISERIVRSIDWTIVHQGQGESDVMIPLFDDANWAEDYDIVVHNYCFTRVREEEFVDRILEPHRSGKPAVLIHGAMHSFRTEDQKWFEFCGVTSPGHGSHHAFEVNPLQSEHEILGAVDHWTTPKGELYFIDKVWPGVVPLAQAESEDTGEKEVVAWTHRYGPSKARVFGTTIGNFNEAMIEPRYLDMVAKGFLWALDGSVGENFEERAPEDSLRSITLEPPAPGLPIPGRNLVSDAAATAMSVGDAQDLSAGAALDGNVATQWRAASAGPTAWRCSLENPVAVGAIAIIWNEEPPPVYLVEGSNNLLDWQRLAEVIEEERSTQIAVHEAEGEFLHFRISVSRTRPGQVVGLREFAVYGEAAAVPAALKLAADSAPRRTEATKLIPVTSGELPVEVELREGFKVIGTSHLLEGFRTVQMVPTAQGAVFVLAAAEDKSSAVVLRIVPNGEKGLETTNFLTGLDPESTIAWDGEWIYSLEDSTLTAYRDTDRNGLADERFRIGPIYRFAEKDSKAKVVFSDMRLGMDGRFYAAVESAESVAVFGKEGPMIELPEHGIVSFTRAGEGLENVLSSDVAINRLHAGRDGELFFQDGASSESPLLSGIREVVSMSDSGLGFSENEVGKLVGIGSSDEFWISVGGEISTISKERARNRAAVFPELGFVERSGLGSLWLSFRDSGRNRESIGLLDTGEDTIGGENMDLQRQADLIGLLGSPSPVIRQEARYEILRRRRFPQSQLVNVVTGSPDPAARVAAIAALNEAAGAVYLPHLVELARDSEPLVRALAFRLLGRYGEARNHSVFGSITEERRPEVTAEILGAITRTGTEAPGIDSLVLQFAANDDRILSAAAVAFLISRESFDVCFATLDDDSKKDLWPVAFAILAESHRQSVVEGIALRLEKTRSPLMRRLALSILTDIYYRDETERVVWEGTKIADLMLRASVADHRVDRAFLIDRMLHRRIPVKDTVKLVELGRENLSLEGGVVELLLDRDTPIYAEDWLLEIVRDSDRDGDLRLSALALLGSIKSPPLLREIFPMLAERSSLGALPETEILSINRWTGNPAHLANVDWLVSRAKSSDFNQVSLAWHTLLSAIDDPGLESDTVERVKGAMMSAIAGPEETAITLLNALRTSAYSGKEAILAKASESANVSVKNLALSMMDDLGSETESTGTLLSDYEDDEIFDRIDSIEGDFDLGKTVFSKLSCADCHNIHGEGPALAPDLASRVREFSTDDLATAILHPEREVVDGYAATEFLLKNGVTLLGHREPSDDESIALLDVAGNRSEVPIEDVAAESATKNSIMPGDLAHDLTVLEFVSLLRYVKSLAADQ